ncbi:MAG: lytic transglycosylase domain-containing protein [Pyrinomonadaceae bacterium]
MKKQMAAHLSLLALMLALSRAEEAQAQEIKKRLEKKTAAANSRKETAQTKFVRGVGRPHPRRMRKWARAFERLRAAAAARHQVDPRALWTIAYLETRFRSEVVSPHGARGPMQLMPATARAYGLRNPHHPAAAIDAAARHVKMLAARYDNRLDLVLASYHAGETSVDAYLSGTAINLPNGKIINSRALRTKGVPPYGGTQKYVARGFSVYSRVVNSQIFDARLMATITPLALPPEHTAQRHSPFAAPHERLRRANLVRPSTAPMVAHAEAPPTRRDAALRPRIVFSGAPQAQSHTQDSLALAPHNMLQLDTVITAAATRTRRSSSTVAAQENLFPSDENLFFDLHSGEHFLIGDRLEVLSSELESPQQRIIRENSNPAGSVREAMTRAAQRRRSVFAASLNHR